MQQDDEAASYRGSNKTAAQFGALDDLWRKIIQDALAATPGVGWVAGFGYLVADAAGLVAYDLNIALFPALLGVTYLIALIVGWIRYR